MGTIVGKARSGERKDKKAERFMVEREKVIKALEDKRREIFNRCEETDTDEDCKEWEKLDGGLREAIEIVKKVKGEWKW